jgi:hypothetical protein
MAKGVDPWNDICVCDHSRAEHGPLGGGCVRTISVRGKQPRPCGCARFTWSHFETRKPPPVSTER